jgi:hypothetical protein
MEIKRSGSEASVEGPPDWFTAPCGLIRSLVRQTHLKWLGHSLLSSQAPAPLGTSTRWARRLS